MIAVSPRAVRPGHNLPAGAAGCRVGDRQAPLPFTSRVFPEWTSVVASMAHP